MKKYAIVRTIDQNVCIHPNMVLFDGFTSREQAIVRLEHQIINHLADNVFITAEQEAEQLANIRNSGRFSDDGKNYIVWEYECKTEGAYLCEKNPRVSKTSDRSFEVVEDSPVEYELDE